MRCFTLLMETRGIVIHGELEVEVASAHPAALATVLQRIKDIGFRVEETTDRPIGGNVQATS